MSYKGFGDPATKFSGRNGPLWFIGLEEAKAPNELSWKESAKNEKSLDDAIEKEYGNRKGWSCEEGHHEETTSVYRVMSKLAVRLLGQDITSWRDFRENKLFRRGQGEFFSPTCFRLESHSMKFGQRKNLKDCST